MNKDQKMQKSSLYLKKALNVLPKSGVGLTRTHIHNAISALGKSMKKEAVKKSQSKHEEWQESLKDGFSKIRKSPMAKMGYAKTLKELNKMIEETQSELDKLESNSEQIDSNNDLFLRD